MPYIPNTLISQAGTSAMTLVETQTAPVGGSASFDFQSISQAGVALMLTWFIRSEAAVNSESCSLRFNNDAAGNYDSDRLDGQDATVVGGGLAATSAILIGEAIGANVASRTGSGVVYIPAYATTTFFKSLRADSQYSLGTAANQQGVRQTGGTWRSTAAISRVTILCATADIAEGSTASLFRLG